jgi:hypothetical protein
MIRLLIPIGMLIVGWIAFAILAQRNEKKVQSEWSVLLNPASERIFQKASLEIEGHTAIVGLTMNEAMEVRQLGDLDEAIRFLNVGGDVIERFTPNLLGLLSIMTKFTRMVSAIAPINPLVPGDFHLSELTSLAHLHRILHHMLASAKQRFRLKLYVLGKALSITSHYLTKSIRNVVTHRSSDDREWEEILGVQQDFQKLSNESVRSFRVLLEALSCDAARELSRRVSLSSTESGVSPSA